MTSNYQAHLKDRLVRALLGAIQNPGEDMWVQDVVDDLELLMLQVFEENAMDDTRIKIDPFGVPPVPPEIIHVVEEEDHE